MKYVKAHKETLRPFREEGGLGMPQEAGQIHCVSKNETHAKALSIRISQDVKNKTKGMLQRKEKKNGWLYLSWAIRVMGPDQKFQENHSG